MADKATGTTVLTRAAAAALALALSCEKENADPNVPDDDSSDNDEDLCEDEDTEEVIDSQSDSDYVQNEDDEDDEDDEDACDSEDIASPPFNTHIFFNESSTNDSSIPVIIFRMASTIPLEQPAEQAGNTTTQSGQHKRTQRSASIDSQSELRAKNPRLSTYNNDEKSYYNSLSIEDKCTVNTVEAMVHEKNQVKIPMRFKVLLSNIDPRIQSIAIKKVDYLSKMSPNNGEYFKMTNWIESLCRIPIGIYAGLPIFKTQISPAMNDISAFLQRTQSILDSAVYGHTESKDQIIRFLAQWIVNPKTKGSVIGIYGPPGIGKTTLVKEGICRALEIPFASIPLGGVDDGSYLDGHSYTYEGSTWGRIVSVLMESQCMNPLLYMDEVDKLSGRKSDEVTGILIHLTDPAQNTAFSDKYFSDVPLDLSRSIMVFTYNDPELISPILRDRMISIEVKPYNDSDKLEIARKHLIPSLCSQFKFDSSDVVISDTIIKSLINMIPEEDGVRSLRRALEHVFSNINLERLIPIIETGVPKYKLPITVTETMLCDLTKKLPSKRSRELVLPMYT